MKRDAIEELEGFSAVDKARTEKPKAASPNSRNSFGRKPLAVGHGIHLWSAGVALAIGIGLLLLMMFQAPLLSRWGLMGNMWYVLLIALGLCASAASSPLFKSVAIYQGEVLGGKLELKGPIVIFFLVLLVGWFLVPRANVPLDITVFLRESTGGPAVHQLASQGRLTLEVGSDRKTEPVGEKGEIRFVGIPSNFRGGTASASLHSDRYELVDLDAKVSLDAEPTTLKVRTKQLPITGYVFDEGGVPLAGARISIAGLSASTDRDGRFALKVPADLAEGDKFVVITAPGLSTYRAAVVPGGTGLQVRLSR